MDRLRSLAEGWSHQPEFRDAAQVLRAHRSVIFDNVVGAARSLLVATLLEQAPSQLVVVVSDGRQLDEICDELPLFTAERFERFPPWESTMGERDLADEIYSERLGVLKRLLTPSAAPRLIVAAIQSLQQPVSPPESLRAGSRQVRIGTPLNADELLTWLVAHGFHSTSAVELPGEFAMRGGILDIFAPAWSEPARIELFGDEVESIRQFDPTTQRSSETREALEIAVLESRQTSAAHFAEFLTDDAWILLHEPAQLTHAAQYYLERIDSGERVFTISEVFAVLNRFAVATSAAVAESTEPATCRLPVESVEHFSGEVGRVRIELDRAAAGHDVIVVSQTDAESHRLGELLNTGEVATQSRLHFAVGGLSRGFRLVRENLVLLSGNDLFQRTLLKRAPRRRLPSKALDSFLDLRAGDLVVHLSHGIGRYRGLKLLEKGSQAEEHLTIEFDAGVKVFVPASRINLVQKYVGGVRSRPALAKIGGKSWVRQKQAAQQAVMDVAADMLSLQAARAARPGIAFARDSEWQREFDAAFPFQETPTSSPRLRPSSRIWKPRADGSTALRRCRFWKDGTRDACCVQGGRKWLSSRHLSSDDRARRTAFSYFSRTHGRVSLNHWKAQPFLLAFRTARSRGRTRCGRH